MFVLATFRSSLVFVADPQNFFRAWSDVTFDTEGYLLVSIYFVSGIDQTKNYRLNTDSSVVGLK